MKLYRADKRSFEIGDVFESAREFTSLNPEGSEIVESIFEKIRPKGKPIRSRPVYLFEEFNCAERHWVKMSGGKLYEVTTGQILHRGDMRHVDGAYKNLSDKELVTEYARMYWLGEMSDSPIVEVLADSAEVTCIVSNDDDERIRAFKRIYMGGA